MRPLFLVLAIAACQTTEDMKDHSPGACAACHTPEYTAAKNHVGERPTTCGICHGQQAWQPSRLDHPWPLVGAHGNGHCLWCHRGDPPVFTGTTKLCIGCHRAEYDPPPFPAHERYPTTCEQCHTMVAWKPTLPNPPIPPEPIPTVVPTVTATVSVPPIASSAPKPKPKPKPKPVPTPPDVVTHPSGH